jgi:Leucine-rich repeat (LRR) protein
LPAEIGRLCNLQTLHLGNNDLSSLPAEIGNLINLKSLNLSNNKLKSLPCALTLRGCSGCPAEIGRLYNLKSLNLSNNKLKSLPCTLALRGCYDYPSEINNLINLEELYLNEDSYEINNLDLDCEILILGNIKNPITNLPCGLKTIYLSKEIDISMIKIPFGCEINYDFDDILQQ